MGFGQTICCITTPSIPNDDTLKTKYYNCMRKLMIPFSIDQGGLQLRPLETRIVTIFSNHSIIYIYLSSPFAQMKSLQISDGTDTSSEYVQRTLP